MTSPAKGLMYDVSPIGVSLVGHPANKSKFLVIKNEQDTNNMEKILEVIKSAESEDEASLIESMKARGSSEDAIDAAVGIKRVLHGFRDVLTEADFTALAETANFKVKKAEVEVETNATEDTETEDNGVTKRDEENQTLRDEVARLTEESRDARLSKLAEQVKVGDQAEILKTLVTVDKSGGDVNAVLEVFKTQSAAAEAGIDSEIGSEREGAPDTGYEAIQAEANRIATEQDISYYDALTVVEKSNRAIVKQYYEDK